MGGMTDRIDGPTHRQAVPTHDDGAPPPRYIELDVDSLPSTFQCFDTPAKTTLFVDGISPSDVRQGGVGDCTLQASLASLARTVRGKAFIRRHVTETPDGFSVSVFRKSASGAYEPTTVHVPKGCLASHGFAHAVDAGGASEVWPRVFEQAMLRANGGVPVANMPEAMSILTGRPAKDIPTTSEHLRGVLARGFAKGNVQVLSTTGRLATDIENPKLKAGHAYTLVGVEAHAYRTADGSYSVEEVYVLRNPWGYDQPPPLTLEQVQKYFSTYSEGDVP